MLTHARIWNAIDRLAEKSGFSVSGLAKQAGLDPTSFNKSKRKSPDQKPRWPSTESISKILSVTGVSMHDFLLYMNDDTPAGNTVIPCIKLGKLSKDEFDKKGTPAGKNWQSMNITTSYEPTTLAIEIDNDLLAPFFKTGQVLFVTPAKSFHSGERVLMIDKQGGIHAGDVLTSHDKTLSLYKFSDAQSGNVKLSKDNIVWHAQIRWIRQ